MEVLIKGLNQEKLAANVRNIDFNVDISRSHDQVGLANPLEFFLLGVCACVSVYSKRYLQKEFAEQLNEVSLKVSGELTKESPFRFTELKVEIVLPFKLGERKEAFLNFIKNCPVHNTIKAGVNFIFDIKEAVI